MPRIDLLESGLLYDTNFSSLDSDWLLSPDDPECISTTKDGLLLNPAASTNGYTMVLKGDLQGSYVIEAELEYTPQFPVDSAGLVLWAQENEAIYVSLVIGGTPYEKLRLRVIGERCEAYAFAPAVGAWELVGTAFLLPGMLPGIYAEGQTPVTVKRFTVLRNTLISMTNLPAGTQLRLLDEQENILGTTAAADGHASLSITQQCLIGQGKIQVLDQEDKVLATTDLQDIYGGDVYWYNFFELNLYHNDKLISPAEGFEPGPLVHGVVEERLELENVGDEYVPYISIRCLSFNTAEGSDWVSLAHDVRGDPGHYYDMIYLPGLAPGERTAFWLKIERPKDIKYFPLTKYRFSLFIGTGSGEVEE